MIPADRLVAFAAVAFVLIVVPGPSVLFVISRGVALGRQAALATVVGNELGLSVQVVAVAAGLGAVVERSVVVYTAVKLVGAAYLVFLGVQAIRHRRQLPAELTSASGPRTTRRIVRDGFVVGVANPKTVVFLGAVLPQFTDPASGPAPLQLLVLGALFVAMALILDGIWGLVAGTARNWLSRSPRRLSVLGATGGVTMVGLGVRMLATGRTD
jgi:threonine/homoserine/homoserine lactone efflux protein